MNTGQKQPTSQTDRLRLQPKNTDSSKTPTDTEIYDTCDCEHKNQAFIFLICSAKYVWCVCECVCEILTP